MKELDLLCDYLNDTRVKTKQTCFDLCFDDVTKALSIYGVENSLTYINEKTKIGLKKEHFRTLYRRSRKKLGIDSIKIKKKTTSIEEKKGETLNSNNIENRKDKPSFQSKHKNLNKPALALMDRYSLTDDDLDKLGIVGISDTMTVFDKIKKHCDKIESDKKMAEFSHLTK